jgi:flagellar basal-body rod protein FlgG
MDPLNLTAASGLRSRLESLELLSNNLANANTAGYKRDSEFYGVYRAHLMDDDPDGADPVTPSLPYIERPWTDFRQGVIERTGNPGDLALSGPGFFAVESPGGVLYTRNGHFRLSSTGTLETADGYAVLSEQGAPLQVTPGREFQIDPSGAVKQGNETVGRLRLVSFADMTGVVKRGYSYFATAQEPAEAAECKVLQGSTEGSNVPVAESAIRLVGLTRQFEMLNRAVAACGEMGRLSIQEVGKVGA